MMHQANRVRYSIVLAISMLGALVLTPTAAVAETAPPSATPSGSTSVTPTPTPTPMTPPAAPQNIHWTKIGTTTVRLSWDAPATSDAHQAATGYVVQTKIDGHASDQGKEVTTTHVTYADIAPNTKLTTSITATNDYGVSPITAGPNWVQPAVAPGVPTGVELVKTAVTSVRVTWGKPADNGGSPVTAYAVTLYKGTAKYYSQTLDAVMLTDTFLNLDRGATYHVEVVAVNKAGRSRSASSDTITIASAPSQSPSPRPSVVSSAPTITVAPPVTKPSPTASENQQLQRELARMRQQRAVDDAARARVINIVVLTLVGALLLAAIIALLFVLRYNHDVDAYNREHGYPRRQPRE